LLRLNILKATDPDDLPPILLRAAAEEIAPSLTDIFQTSARTAALPGLWKVERIKLQCIIYTYNSCVLKSHAGKLLLK
jgi:hypothetical protein